MFRRLVVDEAEEGALMQAAPPEPERKQDPEELNDADRIGRACGQKGHGLGTQHCRKEEDVAILGNMAADKIASYICCIAFPCDNEKLE